MSDTPVVDHIPHPRYFPDREWFGFIAPRGETNTEPLQITPKGRELIASANAQLKSSGVCGGDFGSLYPSIMPRPSRDGGLKSGEMEYQTLLANK